MTLRFSCQHRYGSGFELDLEFEAPNGVTAVCGPSGSGKSSVVRAGLIPRLRADSTHASEIVVMVPGAHPVERLAQALLPLLEPQLGEVKRLAQVSELATLLAADALSLRTVVSRVLEKQPGTSRFVLVVDQWEELYTLASSHDCDLFVRQLLGSADGRQLSVVLTMRGSFYGEALRMRALADRLQGAVVNLSAMSPDEVRSAVVKPAEAPLISTASARAPSKSYSPRPTRYKPSASAPEPGRSPP